MLRTSGHRSAAVGERSIAPPLCTCLSCALLAVMNQIFPGSRGIAARSVHAHEPAASPVPAGPGAFELT